MSHSIETFAEVAPLSEQKILENSFNMTSAGIKAIGALKMDLSSTQNEPNKSAAVTKRNAPHQYINEDYQRDAEKNAT